MIPRTRSQNLSAKPPHLLALIAGLGLVLALGLSSPNARASCASSSNVEGGGTEAKSKADNACPSAGPKGCLELALEAMGGSARLEGIKNMSFEAVGHTLLVEQSYRQYPFITSYERMSARVDFAGNRIRVETHEIWPESDPGQAESDSTMVAGPEGCVRKARDASGKPASDSPCSLADIDWERDALALGPLRLLRTALGALDLHFSSAETVRSTSHTVLAFSWQGMPVRIMLNPFNHLPDAVEKVAQFHDHWYPWGDVRQRIYFDNWQTVRGIRYPTNQVEERNGVLWKSTQFLDLKFEVPRDAALFNMDAKTARLGAQSKGWERSFEAKTATQLAPGITLFPGAWNATLVKQEDGIAVLEAPVSGTYVAGVMAEAKKQYPNLPLTAVMSTSDSWPHVGGVRQAVALNLPVYILDLNKPLLDRLIAAKHELHPDLLAETPRGPVWRIVSQKTSLGSGENRMELYPLRGASTERQYLVYFPQHHLLYASDTLAINDDGTLYDPELMREVVEAVEREGLEVSTVFAMHHGPVAWTSVVALVKKALN